MKSLLIATLAALVAFGAVAQTQDKPKQEAKWLTSVEQARAEAQKRNVPVLTAFIGSDWCGWTQRLQREVLDTPEFKAWAADKAVLLEVDFPRTKNLSADLRTQNDQLAAQYTVQGFPTIVFTDAGGKEIGRTGYIEGGPTRWIPHAESILEGKSKPQPPAGVSSR